MVVGTLYVMLFIQITLAYNPHWPHVSPVVAHTTNTPICSWCSFHRPFDRLFGMTKGSGAREIGPTTLRVCAYYGTNVANKFRQAANIAVIMPTPVGNFFFFISFHFNSHLAWTKRTRTIQACQFQVCVREARVHACIHPHAVAHSTNSHHSNSHIFA